MSIKPLGDRVVIERIESNSTTKAGIIIPDHAQEKPVEGRVVYIGNGKILDNGSRKPIEVKEGQTVLFSKYSGVEVELDGKKLLIMKEEDILATLD